ncbi:MAG TPA: hypothetical protein VHD61_05660 [Lacunisphaera sp.]|nr:hypothetical protein [Lacunisphaera sp.]
MTNPAASRPVPRAVGPLLLAALAVIYGWAHFHYPLYPGQGAAEGRPGWWSWSDQFEYWKSAAAMAGGRLAADSCHYPPGYAALGALCWRLMPADPFFVPNLALVLLAAAAWWRLAVSLLDWRRAVAVGAVFVATHATLLGHTMVVPWNTIPTQAALLAGMVLVLDEARPRQVLWLAVLAAVTYWTRPGDALAFGPLLVLAVARLRVGRDRLRAGLGASLILVAAYLMQGWFNLRVFGAWRSPYEALSVERIGFLGYPFSYKLHWLLVDGRPLFGETAPALLFRYPWLCLAVPGAVHWLGRKGAAAAAGLLAMATSWLLYVNYNDFLPSDIYRFNLIHYLAWTFPVLFLLAAAAVLHGWRERPTRIGFGVAAGLVLLASGLQLDEAPLPAERETGWNLPPHRPLLVHFAGEPAAAVTRLRLDGRPLAEYADYLTALEPADLRLLLGRRAGGMRLSTEPPGSLGGPPQLSTLKWGWRLEGGRLAGVGR